MAGFTHLHLHTAYSFLSGAIHMSDLVPRIQELGMDAVAVTDHANMFGAIDFYRRARQAGVKPILGSEILLVEGDCRTAPPEAQSYQLVLLAKNAAGYRNLMYLVSTAWREGYQGQPRIDHAMLEANAEGLIGLSGSLEGEVPTRLAAGQLTEAKAAAAFYQRCFDPDHFYLEIQPSGRPGQAEVNQGLSALSAELQIPLVATNNCYYLNRDDAPEHDVLMAISEGKSRSDPTRKRLGTDALFLRSPQEMIAAFREQPEAIANTQRIVEMIDLELSLGKPELPNFVPPDGRDLVSYLTEKAEAGLELRFKEQSKPVDEAAYRARLAEELGIIISMKFPGYFLIVADFINWAKENGIPVGPGRGSGAGSIVAWALRITDLDPIPYHLLFERFLNPERISMPDFDVDFCQERRGEVIQYVTEKYGKTRVGQIATYAQMKAKSVIKDVARCLELPFSEINELTKLLPATYKTESGGVKPITIDKAIELEPRLRQLMEEEGRYQEVIRIARKLENLYRQAGMHAAGVVIGNDDLWRIVPVFRGNDGELVTQFNMVDVEEAGLVKFDFLGLKTLDVIDHAAKHANRRIAAELAAGDLDALLLHPHLKRRYADTTALKAAIAAGEDLRLRVELLNLEDPAVYQLIARGDTLGVFQLESDGFRELLKRLKPDCFEDIVAAVALYRPGPLQTGMVDDFVDCKNGKKEVRYPHPSLETILKPTYGGFVYQEQVMQAAQKMASYSLGGADLLRRAMGKKKAEVMAKERVKFVEGCTANQIPEKEAASVFDLMEKFAGYGFNKSHSAAYALITFQTAYMKQYYPVEFMASLLSTESGSTENVVKYIAEARRMRIEVLPPSVNVSGKSFTPAEGKLRFGLGAIKGLGDAALEAILAERESGAFRSLYDFCQRVPLRQLNKKTLEALVRSGAFDVFSRPRAVLMDALDDALEAARSIQKEAAMGQGSLFGAIPELADAVKPTERYDEDGLEWPELMRLQAEKETIGFYLTGHPVKRYAADLARFGASPIARLFQGEGHQDFALGCVVTQLRERPLKDGSGRMAFVTLEDESGQLELAASAQVYQEYEAVLKSDLPLFLNVSAAYSQDDEGEIRVRVRLKDAMTIAEKRESLSRVVYLKLEADAMNDRRLSQLEQVLKSSPGDRSLRVVMATSPQTDVILDLPKAWGVRPTDLLLDGLEQLGGPGCVVFK